MRKDFLRVWSGIKPPNRPGVFSKSYAIRFVRNSISPAFYFQEILLIILKALIDLSIKHAVCFLQIQTTFDFTIEIKKFNKKSILISYGDSVHKGIVGNESSDLLVKRGDEMDLAPRENLAGTVTGLPN